MQKAHSLVAKKKKKQLKSEMNLHEPMLTYYLFNVKQNYNAVTQVKFQHQQLMLRTKLQLSMTLKSTELF